jgi:hypothetical protein
MTKALPFAGAVVEPVKLRDVIPNRAESPVRNLLFSADEPNDRPQRRPLGENRDGRGCLTEELKGRHGESCGIPPFRKERGRMAARQIGWRLPLRKAGSSRLKPFGMTDFAVRESC